MATNSGRGNPIGAEEGLDAVEHTPVPVSDETKSAVSSSSDAVHASGPDAGAKTGQPAQVERPEEVKGDKDNAMGSSSTTS